MKKYISRNIFFWLVLFLTLIAFLFRFYNFERDLLFRIDQERDYQIIKEAFEKGPGHLPLLGPKAGNPVVLPVDLSGNGDALNLGPIYYYFQYFSVLAFRKVSPAALAFPDLFFSVLTIPLFYLILRLVFSRWISLGTTTLWAWSLPLVEYSRFAWNTNQVLFWQLLLFYALWKSFFCQENKKRQIFLLLVFLCLGVLTQLHFIAFFVFPSLVILFWFWMGWPKGFSWRIWMAGGLILFFLYLPVIASDLVNQGENVRRLPTTFFQEGNGDLPKENFWKKSEEIFSRWGQMSSHSVLSFNDNEINGIEKYGGLFFLVGLLMGWGYLLIQFWHWYFYFFLRKRKNKVNPKDAVRMLFFLLAGLLLIVYWKIYRRLDNFRYWLFFVPIFFWIMAEGIGFWEKILSRKFFLFFSSSLFLVCLLGQITNLIDFYYGLEKGKNQSYFGRKLFLDDYQNLISWGMLNQAANRAIEKADLQDGKVCFWVENEQQRKSFKTILGEKYQKAAIDEKTIKKKACVFVFITEIRKNGPVFPKKMTPYFKEKDRETIGSLVLWEVAPLADGKECAIISHPEEFWEFSSKEIEDKATERALIWKDLWSTN